MRTVLSVLFIFQALVAINVAFSKQANLEKGSYGELEDEALTPLGADGSGSSGGEEKGPEDKALDRLVEALGKIILPTVKNATKLTEKRNEEKAKRLFKKLEDGEPYLEVKKAFGKTVMEEHMKCAHNMNSFMSLAKFKGVFRNLSKILKDDNDDDDDEEEIISKVLQEYEKGDGDILAEIAGTTKSHFAVHPAIKAVALIKKLLSQFICGNPIEGFLRGADQIITKNYGSKDNPFIDLGNKVIGFLDSRRKCRKGLVGKIGRPPLTLLKRLFLFTFHSEAPCCDADIIKENVELALQGEKVLKKVYILSGVYMKRLNATVRKVVNLLITGQYYYACEALGVQTLGFLREAFLIGTTVHKRLQKEKPVPPPRFPACKSPFATHALVAHVRMMK